MNNPTRSAAALDALTPGIPNFYKAALDHISDGVYFVDRQRRILYWNEGARRLTGYTAEELVGLRCQDDVLCHADMAGHPLCKEQCPLAASIADGQRHEASVLLRDKQGRRLPVHVRVEPLRDANSRIVGAVEIFTDSTERNEVARQAEELNRLAFLDHVTQLPNRRFLEMEVEAALSEYRAQNTPFAVLMIDLDGFKEINDRHGHSCGDHALRETAQMLSGSMRPDDRLGRWGGDEFLAIVRRVNLKGLERLASRCVDKVSALPARDTEIEGLCLSVSVGAALIRAGQSAEELIHRADQLMYRSKALGGNQATTE